MGTNGKSLALSLFNVTAMKIIARATVYIYCFSFGQISSNELFIYRLLLMCIWGKKTSKRDIFTRYLYRQACGEDTEQQQTLV